MCDYRVNRIWIAACLVLTLGMGAAAVATSHGAPARTFQVAAARPAAASVPAPGDTGWGDE